MSPTPSPSYVRCFSSRHWEVSGQPKHYANHCREVDEYYPARHRMVMVFLGGPEQFIRQWDGYWRRVGPTWREEMREEFHA
jgi:hypothetical protein